MPHVAAGRIGALPLAPVPIMVPWKWECRMDEPPYGPVRRAARALEIGFA